ncbi:MAG: hypothetical protein ABL985_02305 [Casimicrobium sp.]
MVTLALDDLLTPSGRIPRRIASKINAGLRYGTTYEVLAFGLKRYWADFLVNMERLRNPVNAAYMELC